MRTLSHLAISGVLLGALLSCRGKEGPQGPQGPAGQDRTYREQGYISATAKGIDANTSQPFKLQARYTYIPTYYIAGAILNPVTADSTEYIIAREGGPNLPGYISLTLSQGSNGRKYVQFLDGRIYERQGDTIKGYYLFYPSYPSGTDTAYLLSANIQGNTIAGELVYVKHSKTPADTVRLEFSSELVRLESYQRLAASGANHAVQKSE